MNRHVNAIAGRLSLRPPQRHSLEILDRITEIAPPGKATDIASALAAIQSEFPTATDFEREFPSICFSLATGVGKTRLMGAFISYLHLAHGINNFFVLAPNLTIYNKLITDFTPGTPKYVFRGIAEFATEPPDLITGDNYEEKAGSLFDQVFRCKINIFNISKINSEVRGGKSPRIKRLSEYIGESYFDYLAALPDLVLLMDESHRYRASAGVKAINELKPVLGLEVTATPFVEGAKGAVAFKNVVYDYTLASAIADGFVKEPAVVTRRDFNPAGMSAEQIERMKLEDGIRLHESVKVELETYARSTGNKIVKPFVLVIARDTTHAAQLLATVQSDGFFEGRYKGKALQVDSSRSGAEEEEMISRLLKVESTEEPTEIVIHVNMLKEGWDVTNLYTIVPLRAANARILIEQSIGRGLRLPYGKRTGVSAVDRLNIVAHDKFQEIIDDANRPDSPIRMEKLILPAEGIQARTVTVVAQSQVAAALGLAPEQPVGANTRVAVPAQPSPFTTVEEKRIAATTFEAIRRLENQPLRVPSTSALLNAEIIDHLVNEVEGSYSVAPQMEMEALVVKPDISAIVRKVVQVVEKGTISIPRVLVVPSGEVKRGYKAFKLELGGLKYQPVSEELWVQHLRTNQRELVTLGKGNADEARLEDYVVSGLVDFEDISYDEHAGLLYDLAAQVVKHLKSYLPEADVAKVLRCYQKPIAQFVHAQMQPHFWEEAAGYEVKVSKGFERIRESAFSAIEGMTHQDYRQPPADKSKIGQIVFGGFARCLQTAVKFQSDTERKMAVILERDSERWFKPAKGQFQIVYRVGSDHREYLPDFIAETEDAIYMLETKASNEASDPEVVIKKNAAQAWCERATAYTIANGGKPWRYAIIPHTAVGENMTLENLGQFYQ